MSEMVTGTGTKQIGEYMVVSSRIHDDMFSKYMELQWIPVKERLPENDKPVLVTLKWGEDNYEITTGEYWKDGKGEDEGWGSFNDYVIAWMPLPDAYREGEA